MKLEYVNINNNVEDIFVAKKSIEDYLIDKGDISEKMELGKFIEYLHLGDYAFVGQKTDIVIPFAMVDTDTTKYVFNVCKDKNESEILSNVLSEIEYDTSKLTHLTTTDVFNGKLSDKDFFVINKEYYIV